MWLTCVHFNRLFYSDSNDVWIVWGLWGLFSQVVNSLLLCCTFSPESLAYLLCSPVAAHSHPPHRCSKPKTTGGGYMVCVVCTGVCVLFVCMCVVYVLYVCMCPMVKSPEARKSHRLTLPGSYLLIYLHGL